jgi:TolA-binding protein
MPDQLKSQIRENEKEITAQQAAVDGRVKEMDEIRTRFAEERKRFLELTGKKSAEGMAVIPAAEAKPTDAAVPAADSAPAAAPAKPTDKK